MSYLKDWHNNDLIIQLRRELANECLANLTHYFNEFFLQKMLADANNIYREKKIRRDLLIPQTNNTPRHMWIVTEKHLEQGSSLIKDFYYDLEVLHFLSKITGKQVDCLDWEGEKYLINGLEKDGDTHGWHWDDYAYVLVLILQSPQAGGGEIAYIPNVEPTENQTNIQEVLNSHPIQYRAFNQGQVYFMRSNQTLHCVTPLETGSQRRSLVFTYSNEDDRKKNINHDTITKIYNGE